MTDYTLHLGDCLEYMATMPDASVDAVVTDPPYGTTACKWDGVIPFEPMWAQLKRIVKPRAAIVLFGSQPFTSALVMSNPDWFKYEWVWEKSRPMGYLNARHQPLRKHENVVVFSSGGAAPGSLLMPYFPQNVVWRQEKRVRSTSMGLSSNRKSQFGEYICNGSNFPSSILKFGSEGKTAHPTQKPVALLEYLIRTYTNAGDTVLDFTMGSGTTGVACMNTGRKFIGCELEPKYFEIAKQRIEAATMQSALLREAAD